MSLDGVPVGLNDLYYALLTSDASAGAVYETPVKITGAITANINPNSSIETLFADDGPIDTASQLGNIELELAVADIPLSVQAVLLGHTETDGVVHRKSTDIPPWLAIGFKSVKSNGSYRYVWLNKGKFMVPELNHQTKEDTVNFQTMTITGRFVKREYDDEWEKHTDEDSDDYESDTGADWFTDGPDAP